MSESLVVNIFGGPGTGKSTTAALLFGALKEKDINCELVHEYAKDLTWEERSNALAFQPYIAAKQHYHMYRVMGKVDVIVTDSPILLSCIYKGDGYTTHLGRHIIQSFNQWDSVNVFLKRDSKAHPYRKAGRNQTEQEAIKVDNKILSFLRRNQVPYNIVKIEKDSGAVDGILQLIDNHTMFS